MANKSGKIRTIIIIYWVLLLYIIAALVWWYVALSRQNEQMTTYKIQELQITDIRYREQYKKIMDENKRKTAQYLGEGAIFFLLISAGAIFLFRAVKNQLKITTQQQNFMMAITHELKTPIAVTKLNLETLQKRKLETSQQEKLINNTLQEANRMNALCNNLLLSSQMESEAYKKVSEQIQINKLLGDCIRDFSVRYPSRNIMFNPKDEITIDGDVFLLQMAFNNLIENALKYSPKDTAIQVVLAKKENQCQLAITDEGNGIPDEDKLKIFEKFYRIGSDATQKSKGTGLGLFLVKRIVDAHKGMVYVKDNQPKGSIFTIQLPLMS
jgi:two-component system, OmpR family, sensor histidine kinase CiaH